MRQTGATQTLLGIQALRAIAALMVVVGHASGTVRRLAAEMGIAFPGIYVPGGAGVDLFFVISGFIMLYVSEPLFGRAGAPVEFMRRRLLRIVPLYWLCTALFVLTLALGSRGLSGVSVTSLMASLFFVPIDTFGHPQGMAFPIFDLGWTLNYEMMFYLVFAACLVLPREKAAVAAIGAIVALVALGLLLAPSGVSARFWTAPISAEFALGVAIALAKRRGLTLPAMIRIGLVVVAVGLLFADPGGLVGGEGTRGATTPNDVTRVVYWGLPAAMVLAAATLGSDLPDHPVSRMLGRIGDASYSLYLTHPFVLIAALKITPYTSRVLGFDPWIVLAACIAGAIAVAMASFLLFERPSYAWLRGIGRDRSRTAPPKDGPGDAGRVPAERRTA